MTYDEAEKVMDDIMSGFHDWIQDAKDNVKRHLRSVKCEMEEEERGEDIEAYYSELEKKIDEGDF